MIVAKYYVSYIIQSGLGFVKTNSGTNRGTGKLAFEKTHLKKLMLAISKVMIYNQDILTRKEGVIISKPSDMPLREYLL